MASLQDIQLAFQRSGIGRGPTPQEIQLYSSFPDAGKVEGDIRAGGGGITIGNVSGGSANDILGNAVKSITSMFPSPVKPYEQVNPFSFDEALAKQASTAEYVPYYDEMLKDYTGSVERAKSRSQEDLDKTIEQLNAGKEYYIGTERRLLDKTLDNTNKGYAGQGLFFSGAKQKDIEQIKTEYGAQTGEYNRQYQYNVGQAKQSAQRSTEDINTASSMYSRDIGRAKDTAIQQGVLQRQSEAIQQYELGRQKYYGASGTVV